MNFDLDNSFGTSDFDNKLDEPNYNIKTTEKW